MYIDTGFTEAYIITTMTQSTEEFHQLTPTGRERKLTVRQREVIDYITTQRVGMYEAAKHLKMDATNLYRMLRHQHVADEIQDRLAARMKSGALLAGEELIKLLNHKSPYVKLQASEAILKMTEDKGQKQLTTAIQVNINLS